MTVHAAKGLEFPYVFLCGLNEGIFPARRVRTLQAMEEERRLAFVAMTRAEKGLFLSEAEGRNFDGSPRYPSRFLLDIDPTLLTFTREAGDGLIREARSYIENSRNWLIEDESNLLSVGTRIRHNIFGPGSVLELDKDRSAYVIRFDNLSTPRRISFRVKLDVISDS